LPRKRQDAQAITRARTSDGLRLANGNVREARKLRRRGFGSFPRRRRFDGSDLLRSIASKDCVRRAPAAPEFLPAAFPATRFALLRGTIRKAVLVSQNHVVNSSAAHIDTGAHRLRIRPKPPELLLIPLSTLTPENQALGLMCSPWPRDSRFRLDRKISAASVRRFLLQNPRARITCPSLPLKPWDRYAKPISIPFAPSRLASIRSEWAVLLECSSLSIVISSSGS